MLASVFAGVRSNPPCQMFRLFHSWYMVVCIVQSDSPLSSNPSEAFTANDPKLLRSNGFCAPCIPL